ncbi:MAG: TetR family transcriptional regulator [Chloroflexi bacterium]|nr:TetR family transcriptional regulator [Chloroflexota bacterium]
MSKLPANESADARREAPKSRPVRADAQRNTDALLAAALAVFATSGVDAPVREIAEKAGVGIGTREIDACADAASILAAEHDPGEALAKWMQRYAAFVATKRGLAAALHSGDPAFNTLPAYFDTRLRPALRTLLDAAVRAGEVRTDIDADDLLSAVASLCMSIHDDRPDYARRMVALLVDGLRYNARPAVNTPS